MSINNQDTTKLKDLIVWENLSDSERGFALARPAIAESGLLSQQVENILANVRENGD